MIGFLSRAEGSAHDYLRRLSRLRWKRPFPARRSKELFADRPAAAAFSPGETWIVVRDEIALPVDAAEISPQAGRVGLAAVRSSADRPVVHTLSELERTASLPTGGTEPRPEDSPALAFAVSDFPPRDGESVAAYLDRLLSEETPHYFPPRFVALVFGDVGGERLELTRHFPRGIRRLLDVGCGSGAASRALRRVHADLSVTGIERDPAAAERARTVVNRVIERDAAAALRELGIEGARFDAFLFADVLEHLDDPIRSLALARDLALPDATFVASVPNVGHLSIVRDLVIGRFDPVAAGLADAGHLRWFTRGSLEEWLEEAGWSVVTIERIAGEPAPDADEFLRFVERWPELDRESLTTYQWIAVASPKSSP